MTIEAEPFIETRRTENENCTTDDDEFHEILCKQRDPVTGIAVYNCIPGQ